MSDTGDVDLDKKLALRRQRKALHYLLSFSLPAFTEEWLGQRLAAVTQGDVLDDEDVARMRRCAMTLEAWQPAQPRDVGQFLYGRDPWEREPEKRARDDRPADAHKCGERAMRVGQCELPPGHPGGDPHEHRGDGWRWRDD